MFWVVCVTCCCYESMHIVWSDFWVMMCCLPCCFEMHNEWMNQLQCLLAMLFWMNVYMSLHDYVCWCFGLCILFWKPCLLAVLRNYEWMNCAADSKSMLVLATVLINACMVCFKLCILVLHDEYSAFCLVLTCKSACCCFWFSYSDSGLFSIRNSVFVRLSRFSFLELQILGFHLCRLWLLEPTGSGSLS